MNNHPDTELKIYELTNHSTGETHTLVSHNAQDACKQAGWLIGNCSTREIKPELKAPRDGGMQPMVRIPCQACPYQYAECTKPAQGECPLRHKTPTITEWIKNVIDAHLCDYTGDTLTERDYGQRHKWCPIGQAIEELREHS